MLRRVTSPVAVAPRRFVHVLYGFDVDDFPRTFVGERKKTL